MVAALVLGSTAGAAGAEIWECVDDVGNKRFTNIREEAKGCRLLSLPAPNTVPAVRPPAKAAPPAGTARARSPGDFPRVDGDTQRRRDDERRRILEREYANEQRLLEEARRELAEQESIRLGNERNYQRVLDRLEPYRRKVKLHEDNLANLKRELAGLR